MSITEGQLARYGEIVARLAMPLADRDAVLWLSRIDDAGFEALQRACLDAIRESDQAAARFAKHYAETQHRLVPSSPTEPSPTRATPPTEVDGDLTLADAMETVAVVPPKTVAPLEADMHTLASTTHVVVSTRDE